MLLILFNPQFQWVNETLHSDDDDANKMTGDVINNKIAFNPLADTMTYTKTYTMTYTKIVAPFNQQASMTGIAQSFCRPTIIACRTILCVHLMI